MRRPTHDEWLRIRDMFDALVALPPRDREKRLEQTEPYLADELRSLLNAEREDGILDRPPTGDFDGGGSDYSSLTPGTVIGGFRIERLIGRGGMGEVYLAVRTTEDFEQRAALKLLRPEAAGRSPLFDAERRLLAGLEHPGIARLIDGGIAPDGRPYMALEYVEGLEIDRWCDAASADLALRLKLFLEICDAVSYAHARLVVHQDIKPSNILVDNDGRARLLDFGVARLIEDVDADRTATLALLTPDYAAPEQFEQRQPTIATDIYSLGAILFELLTGQGPWHFQGASLPSALHRLLHDDPPVPSKVAREGSPPIPATQIAGDLDAIILKAMRRAPAERYASVGALAADIRRHIAFEPVRARQGNRTYVVRRFARRHRWGVMASAAVVLALLAGGGGIAWQAHRAATERDVARAEARHAEAVNRAVTLMFSDAQDRDIAGSATAKQMLDDSAAHLAANLDPNSPDAATTVRAIGDLYVLIEDPAAAESFVEHALAKGVGRNDPVEKAELLQILGNSKASMSKFDEARPLLAAAARVWRTDPARFRTERLDAIAAEAQMRRLEGDRDGALAMLLNALPEAELAYADNPRELLTRYANLSVHLIEANRLDEADAILKRGEATIKRTGEQNSAPALAILQMRGAYLTRRGNVAAAVPLLQHVAKVQRDLYGPSAGLSVDLLQLGRTLLAANQPEEGLARLDEAEPMARQYLGPLSQPDLMIQLYRGEALAALGRDAEADKALRDAAPALGVAGPQSLQYGAYLKSRAYVRMKEGRLDESTADLAAAQKLFAALGPPAQPYAEAAAQVGDQLRAARAR